MRLPLYVLVTVTVLTACQRRDADRSAAEPRADTVGRLNLPSGRPEMRAQPESTAATPAPASAQPPSPTPPAATSGAKHPMVGTWEVHPTKGGSPWFALAVDQVTGRTFKGHVVNIFAGDVGLDPSQFGPIQGTLTADTAFTLRFGSRDPKDPKAIPVSQWRGIVRNDTWDVQSLNWAGMEWVSGEREWKGKKAIS